MLPVDEGVVLFPVLAAVGEGHFNVMPFQMDDGVQGFLAHRFRKQVQQPVFGDVADVSYTHLLRQSASARRWTSPGGISSSACPMPPRTNMWKSWASWRIYGGRRGISRITAVSYTHLDVYKRQSVPRVYPARFTACAMHSRASSADFRAGANPPSSPTAVELSLIHI